MNASPGTVVPFAATEEHKLRLRQIQADSFHEIRPPERLLDRPKHIAFLTDQRTISAPEAALLSVRRSPKVTLFGRNTAGATDYQNMSTFAVGSGEWRYLFGVPSIASSNRLPKGGFRATGVPVDIPIDLGRVEPISFILRHYGLDR
jgi:hypothetical protein